MNRKEAMRLTHQANALQSLGLAVAVEHRYISDIVTGIRNDGFIVG